MQLLKLPNSVILVFLTASNLLIYLDRGALGVTYIQALVYRLKSPDNLSLTETQAGMLGSLFMFGYMIANPVFAYSSQYFPSIRIVAMASVVWMFATMLAGLSNVFWSLVVARILTGIAEASFVSLVPPIIMDIAPANVKTLWLAVFLSVGAAGQAVGYIYGEFVYSALHDWHMPFLIESLAMIPFTLLFFSVNIDKIQIHNLDSIEPKLSILRQIRVLFSNSTFLYILLGMSSQTFTVGAIAFWGPDYLESYYLIEPGKSVLLFGGITIVCSLTGSYLGSAVLDSLIKPKLLNFTNLEDNEEEVNMIRTIESLKMLSYAGFMSCAAGCIAVFCANKLVFLVLLAVTEMLIFIGTGPQGTSVMTCVPHSLRAQSCAVSIFVQHLLGDFPSAYIVGWMNDVVGKQYAMCMVVGWLIWSGMFWLIGYIHIKEEYSRFRTKLL